MRWGFEAYYIDYVDMGDSEYIKFWDRVKRKPAETVFNSMEEVMQKHKEPVIIHDLQSSIDIYSKDHDIVDSLEIFYKGQIEYYGLIVTENSPLGPMLQHGTKLLFERGVLDNLKAMWMGGIHHRHSSSVLSSTMVLGVNHVVLALGFLGGCMLICLLIILAEIIWTHPEVTVARFRAIFCRHARANHKEDKNTDNNKSEKKDEANRKNRLGQLFELFFK